MNIKNVQVKVLSSELEKDLEEKINDVMQNIGENMVILDTKYSCACCPGVNLFSVLITIGEVMMSEQGAMEITSTNCEECSELGIDEIEGE